MPQLDKITYISQALWIFLICINSYIVLIFILFVSFINIKKLKLNDFSATILLFFNINSVINAIHFYKKNIL